HAACHIDAFFWLDCPKRLPVARDREHTLGVGVVWPNAGFESLEPGIGPNYSYAKGVFTISRDGQTLGTIEPEKRVYVASRMPTTEAGIMTLSGIHQFYLSLGDPSEDQQQIVVRVWWKPWVTLIWYGALIMCIAGIMSLSDRRLRIGAPQPAKRRARETGPMAQPAE
ncbi:MAG: cytochrome c-type biogenesis CcmF C-terminal domain-containing protein, partial [Pseudomonadota bacterium]